MNELKEIDITFKVRVATYEVKHITDKKFEILEAFQDVIRRSCYSKGIHTGGVLTISGEETL